MKGSRSSDRGRCACCRPALASRLPESFWSASRRATSRLLYPERTVRSIKRKMGRTSRSPLGDQEFTPQEISAFILRELVEWADRRLGDRPEKAVITVPAYFSDAQRNATREAGALAGLEVVRILNEPTAAQSGLRLSRRERVTRPSSTTWAAARSTSRSSASRATSPRCWPATATTAGRRRLRRSAGGASGGSLSGSAWRRLAHRHRHWHARDCDGRPRRPRRP